MKNILSIILILSVKFSFAQNNFILPDSSSQFITNSNAGIASTGITQAFMNKFIFPGHINNDLKDASSKKLSALNYFGGEINGEFKVLSGANPDTSKSSKFFGIGFSSNLQGDLRFTKDLFDLTFYGNKKFAGQTLNFNKTSFNSLAYSTLEFTLGKTKKTLGKNTFSYWVDFGLLLGHSVRDFDFKEASLFTEASGDYIELTVKNSSILVSDTLSTNFIQGIGGKLDLNFIYQTEKSKTFISIENLGAIAWNDAVSADIDTTFRFDGVEVGNIFELSDSVFTEVSQFDSLYNSKKGTVVKELPINFSAYYKRELDLIDFDIFARYRLFANYNPFIRAGVYFKPIPIITPGITVGYGGYSNLIAGVNTDLNIGLLKIQLGTNNVLGGLLPNSFTSLDAYAGVRLMF